MDKWFVFDFILVLNMVVETWLLPAIVALSSDPLGNTIDMSMLRTLRLVKLLRLSRISRILRSVPELSIIVKAIGLSARSVSVFVALWVAAGTRKQLGITMESRSSRPFMMIFRCLWKVFDVV